jgi:DNA-binding phage protein
METRPMYSNVEIIDNFSEWLREHLDTRKMSVVRLSQLSGVHANTIRNYLSNRCEPTFYNVTLLVKALGYEVGAVK